jgi:outer membrane protein OmpA-like peptidoglycan-associated protein/tetratricopeptide (TPR) repeat protein
MKTLAVLLACLLLLCVPAQSQNEITGKDAAEMFFMQEKFADALPLFLNVLQVDTTDIILNYYTGLCYLHSRSQKSASIPYLERAIALYERSGSTAELPVAVYKQLADAYHQSYNLDKAIAGYEKYKKLLDASLPGDKKELEETNWKLEMCHVGKTLDGLTAPVVVKKAPVEKVPASPVNPRTYSSFLSADQSKMTITFRRESAAGAQGEDARYYEPTLVPAKTDTANTETKKIKFEKKNKNETTIATSVDGQIVLNYRDENGTAALYTTSLNGNSWSLPEKISKAVNTIGWEQDEYVSADGNTMYFTSSRKGGFGGKDIYVCRKLEDGEWSKAENLGPVVNTPYDEEAPFIHPDGVTLYFSSNGRQTPGHYDIFTSTLHNGNWSLPVNVGFPADSTHDLVQDIPEKPVPVVTVKHKKKSKEQDVPVDKKENYLISFSNLNGAPLTLLKGALTVPEGKPQGSVQIFIRNNGNNQTNGVYYSDSVSGKFAMILPPESNNNIAYSRAGYLIFSENINLQAKKELFEKRTQMELLAVEKNNKTVLSNVFYEQDKAVLQSTSGIALNDLLLFLTGNPAAIVEFDNTIIAKENMKMNSRLSQERAEAIVAYLSAKGIAPGRLIARGTAVKLKHARGQVPLQQLELKIIENNQDKAMLSTQ